MLKTIRHQDSCVEVAAAKLLTGYAPVTGKVTDIDSFLKLHQTFEAEFVAYVVSWQGNRDLTPDGVIGPQTWTKIAACAPTCSTSKNRTSAATLALQLLLNTNITCDGIFGPRTKDAVTVFQASKGLAVDGICGPQTWTALLTGAEVQPGNFKQPVDFKQYDKRWGKLMYSNHGDPDQTMASSACGPTAMADIVATLKDPNVTPYDLALKALAWGDRSDNRGTNWTFFKHVADEYSFAKYVPTGSLDALKACLDAGGYAVCSMDKGYWTSGGHFITAWKYDATYIYCNDPVSTDRKKQKLTDFMKQRKNFFCFYPDPAPEPREAETLEDVMYTVNPVRGEKIVDISKYQAEVDYDALAADTALIILRAGYRGTGGGIHQDQVFERHAGELSKRGVRFGVYFYSIATSEDKAREEARMFWQYAKDYAPLFWAGDFEKEGITAATIRAFVDELRKLGAARVGCYVANHLYTKYDYASIAKYMDFTWIPRYSATRPAYPCDLWQYTSTGSVNGIAGNVDLSRITGDGRSLAWFTRLTGGDGA